MARRRPIGWFLLIAFVVVPIVEIYVLIQVGQVIGAWWTVVLLILDSAIGSWLIKREGSRAFRALRSALESGRMPGDELGDGALILIGGTLMLSPGFVLDILGVLLIVPLTRPLFRGVLSRVVTRRLTVMGPLGATGPARGGQTNRPGPGSEGPVVRGEVVED
ncbi:FxsA family protein [Nocardioides sp.]|uniref:FxsA family protein n=1 Tax=Nocardioides sp. TaxID=35761 RepID=UPI002B2729AE|nr:FxsA family protein [Nocardioides sp.]